MLRELVIKNRSYRRFHEDEPVSRSTLLALVDLARLAASSANLQPLKYILSCEPRKNSLIFPHLSWAGYLKDWPGPAPGERPPAYIIVTGDHEITGSFGCDQGIAAGLITLGAVEKGLGCCIISSIDRPALSRALNIPPRYEVLLVIAVGRPAGTVRVETLSGGGDIKYWRDGEGVHHVPKRRLEDIVLDL